MLTSISDPSVATTREHIPVRTTRRHLAITGCPKSGTLFMAHVLNTSGYNVTHEHGVGTHGIVSFHLAPTQVRSDHVDDLQLAGFVLPNEYSFGRVLHQVRHPLKTIASLEAMGLNEGPARLELHVLHIRQTWDSIAHRRTLIWRSAWPCTARDVNRRIVAARVYVGWNRLAKLRAVASGGFTYRVENIENMISRFSSLEFGWPMDGLQLNLNPDVIRCFKARGGFLVNATIQKKLAQITWSELRKSLAMDPQLFDAVAQMASEDGYDHP